MSAGNINWAFGDGGDEPDLCEAAEYYGYALHDDGLWRETCNYCKGSGNVPMDLSEIPGWALNDGCAEGVKKCGLCEGKGHVEEGNQGFTDGEMWQYIWDRRESDAEDLALL